MSDQTESTAQKRKLFIILESAVKVILVVALVLALGWLLVQAGILLD